MSEPTTAYETTTLAEEQAALTALRMAVWAALDGPHGALLAVAHHHLMEVRRMIGDRLRQEAGG